MLSNIVCIRYVCAYISITLMVIVPKYLVQVECMWRVGWCALNVLMKSQIDTLCGDINFPINHFKYVSKVRIYIHTIHTHTHTYTQHNIQSNLIL